MLVVRYYAYDSKNDRYMPDCVFCRSVESCTDGNVRLLACNLDSDDPRSVFIIKASQLIDVKAIERKD